MATDVSTTELGASPTVEVRVYRWGRLVHRQLCETVDDAGAVVEFWSELEGVECEVDDLSASHGPGDILEPSAEPVPDEDYPRVDGAHEEESTVAER